MNAIEELVSDIKLEVIDAIHSVFKTSDGSTMEELQEDMVETVEELFHNLSLDVDDFSEMFDMNE